MFFNQIDRLPLLKKVIASVLATIILSTPLLAQTQGEAPNQNAGTYLEGKVDGARDAKGNPLWILAGLTGTFFCLCIGCVGIGVAYFVKPSPPAEKLVGKSDEYVRGYTEAYQNKARKENALWATAGCATAALINLVINIIMGTFPPRLPE